MKKGFTLIELLAVIVILAIIALITIPIIADSISESREKSAIRAAELYVQAIDQELAKQNLDGTFTLEDGCYTVNEEGNLEDDGEELLEVSAKNKPTGGTVCIEDLSVKRVSSLNLNDKYVSSRGDKYVISKANKTYKPGEVVYFDVKKGEACTENDYKKSYDTYEVYRESVNEPGTQLMEVQDYGNSMSYYNGLNGSGKQNSCLMFYVISDNGADLTLILDHDVDNEIFWSNNDSNAQGPVTALAALKIATTSWNGTLTPTNYSYHRDEDACYDDNSDEVECQGIDYTINYSGYKARLITAEEVVELANISNYNNYDDFYFSGGFTSTNEMKNNINWLIDRLSYENYAKNLFLNDSDSSEIGYWTATASSYYDGDEDISSYSVNGIGELDEHAMTQRVGIRPVIEVLKESL